jgi:hypothetical protein
MFFAPSLTADHDDIESSIDRFGRSLSAVEREIGHPGRFSPAESNPESIAPAAPACVAAEQSALSSGGFILAVP